MPITTFSFDEHTEGLFEDLKRDFNATSKAEVMRRAISLLELARQAKQENREIAITERNGSVVKTIMIT